MQVRCLNGLLEPNAAAQITAALASHLLTWTDGRVTCDGRLPCRPFGQGEARNGCPSGGQAARAGTANPLNTSTPASGRPGRTRSEILREAKQRLEFVKKGFNHNLSLEQALAYVRHRQGTCSPANCTSRSQLPPHAPRQPTTLLSDPITVFARRTCLA
ncbi:conserved hypothetical protein [Streptomyces sviceus ATCC 29083]|uniref:Uncharacterized protein n=1 Tax=Streptomyces sviceus (strain ATCC 29083 / DSM 924 / JCM 4929 / NBRC 13980 / NCIMB 11184 / NRRL 5439 / UC 5370) TaxID=463191 RepID=B5HUS4_STRX2|nr:conserved hypothetical protein [Streptomyces sviceus ATCC 29083]